MSDGEHETGIEDMLIEEFDMYLHHQRERNEQFNKRRLRIMFYSLSQQIGCETEYRVLGTLCVS